MEGREKRRCAVGIFNYFRLWFTTVSVCVQDRPERAIYNPARRAVERQKDTTTNTTTATTTTTTTASSSAAAGSANNNNRSNNNDEDDDDDDDGDGN